MNADLSRDTFDRAQHYSAVRLQQGRIVTDADWNEQADIVRHRAERLARDTVGACGAPTGAAGWRLVAETNALAVQALNANVAWIAAEDGVLLATSNGGADWTLAALETAAHLRAIASAGVAGWVVGDAGAAFRTGDGGLSWVARPTGSVRTLRGVAAADADRAWAVGDGGIVLSTQDGGVTWTLAQTAAARLYAVSFADAFDGLAVGQGGAIVATRDGGDSWSGVPSGTGAHLRAIARFDASRVWVAGQGGTILRSEDAGQSWLPCGTPTTATLRAIAFSDAAEGWAVGDGGTVLHSLDGGATWQQEAVDAGGGRSLRGLALFDGEPAWAVGDASAALRLGNGSPGTAPLALPAFNLSIEPGRCYVDGVLCELEARSAYANQPDGGSGGRLASGAYLMYLDAWQRPISALEAPAIREVALGGPDTATRARTIAQVRALALPPTSPPEWHCDADIEGWNALAGQPRPRLAARAEPQPAATSLCEIAATAGYRRLENQLYRVEVHAGGAHPAFKWSRENGSVAYAVVGVVVDAARQQTTVRVAARGRDANLDLAAHDRVELIDDAAALTQRAGALFEYLADGDDALELVLAGVPPGALGQDAALHPVLRRWDHPAAADGANLLPIVEGAWIDLEDGVQVRFEPGGVYRPGDYWRIPARTVTADVEWPRDDDGDPVARTPDGIDDAYCRLGIVEVDAGGVVSVASDCRELFPPLTALEQLLYVGGDGQQAAAGAVLAQPLEVRVVSGSAGIAGVRLAVAVEQGGGTLAGSAEPVTDADGYAAIGWQLGGDGPQRLTVRLDDGAGHTPQRIAFNATVAGGAATARAGCDLTIGRGGDFERLDNELLGKLLQQTGAACLCFLPGEHELDDLEFNEGQRMRLSLHGCGPTARLRIKRGVTLAGFAALELRDLSIELAGGAGVTLRGNDELRLARTTIARAAQQSNEPVVLIDGARVVRMSGCDIGAGPPAALVFDGDLGDECHVVGNRFAGTVSFYGMPGDDLSQKLFRALSSAQFRLAPKTGRLRFCDNSVQLLTIGQKMTERLMETQAADAVLQTALLQGNTFEALGNVFASGLLSVGNNGFVAEPPAGVAASYGVLVANRAAAAGNVALTFGEQARLRFLTPGNGGFSGAANQVMTQPPSS